MRILLDELRLRRFSLLMWTLAVVATVAMVDLLYPSMGRNAGYDQVMASMPEELQALFGSVSMGTPEGFLSIELYSVFLPAILIAYAIGRGASSVAGEEEAHTLDLLLSQPVSRASVYLQKALAMVLGVTVLSFASWATTAALAGPSQLAGLDLAHLAAVTVNQGLLAVVTGLLALAVAVAAGSRTLGIALAGGYAFLAYLVEGLGSSVDWLDRLRPLSAWNWYGVDDPLINGFTATYPIVFVVVGALAAAAGLLAFQRRDLRA
jgi:ABC-2 type transport system permease protein